MKPYIRVTLISLAAALSGLLATACSTAQKDTAAAEVDAEALFVQNCANCHGIYGEGDGPAAAMISINPPNLRQIAQRNNGQFPHETVVQIIDGRSLSAGHDLPGMPAWGSLFMPSDMSDADAELYARQRVSALAEYLESIQL